MWVLSFRLHERLLWCIWHGQLWPPPGLRYHGYAHARSNMRRMVALCLARCWVLCLRSPLGEAECAGSHSSPVQPQPHHPPTALAATASIFRKHEGPVLLNTPRRHDLQWCSGVVQGGGAGPLWVRVGTSSRPPPCHLTTPAPGLGELLSPDTTPISQRPSASVAPSTQRCRRPNAATKPAVVPYLERLLK